MNADEPLPLLIKLDRELGYAFFCPACKTFLLAPRDGFGACEHCGQALDYAAPRTWYTGKVRWGDGDDKR